MKDREHMADRGKILVADGDPAVGLGCGRALGAEGYAVESAGTGAEALRGLAAGEFDLLIASVNLPGVNGMEVLRVARKVRPEMDVIIIADCPSLEDAKEAIRLGAFEYLEKKKPFMPGSICDVASKLLGKRGWILRKAFADRFMQYVVPASDLDDRAVQCKDGAWARPVGGGWEIGFDARQPYPGGEKQKLIYMDMTDQPAVTRGEPFARVLLGEGRIMELTAPVSGVITQRNDKVNETIAGLASGCLSEDWLVWLLRTGPAPDWDKGGTGGIRLG